MKSFWKIRTLWDKLHKIGDFLHLPDIPGWLLAILSSVFLLRIPSFFEPYYYGDEMIYMTLGQGVRQGLTLYKEFDTGTIVKKLRDQWLLEKTVYESFNINRCSR